jgi:hypothetical protein
VKAVVQPFFAEMELALGAASAVVSRAGASSLAEIAAMRTPSVLVPFPHAADNHQFYNARAFQETGAARLLEQQEAAPENILVLLLELVEDIGAREKIQAALVRWHSPKAAAQIAEMILQAVARSPERKAREAEAGDCDCGNHAAQVCASDSATDAPTIFSQHSVARAVGVSGLEIGDTAALNPFTTRQPAVAPPTVS